jgi:ATP-binding cassette subfamily C exporter for protease/lipase
VRNLAVMQALGMRRALRERWQRIHARAVDAQMRSNDVIMGLTSWSMPIRFLFQIIVLGAGALLVIRGELEPGVMIAANILTMRAMMPAMKAMSSWRGFLDARDAYARLAQYMDANEPGDDPDRPARQPDPYQPAIAVAGLAVDQPDGDGRILDGVDLSVARGEMIGVTGPNGAGKSTLAKAALGIWPAQAGAVSLAGVPLAELTDGDRRALIGYVPQNVALFEGTIAENIRRFGPKDDAGVVAAAKQAGVHGIILRLPEGYDTRVSGADGALTGGQRQRIAVARALYGDPAVIVLDEANANLDSNGEEAMLEALSTARGTGSGVLMITHKPSLLRSADRVIRLEAGRVAAEGTPAEILGARATGGNAGNRKKLNRLTPVEGT